MSGTYLIDGKQKIEATGTSNKRLAQKILDLRLAEIIEGRFRLPKSNPPRLEQFSDEFLDSIPHLNTRKRYASSMGNLRAHFGDAKLSEIDAERIDEFKDSRLASKVRGATASRRISCRDNGMRI